MKEIVDETLSNIQGGSAVDMLVGLLAGATIGIKLCTSRKTWTRAGCGIGGAIIGVLIICYLNK